MSAYFAVCISDGQVIAEGPWTSVVPRAKGRLEPHGGQPVLPPEQPAGAKSPPPASIFEDWLGMMASLFQRAEPVKDDPFQDMDNGTEAVEMEEEASKAADRPFRILREMFPNLVSPFSVRFAHILMNLFMKRLWRWR